MGLYELLDRIKARPGMYLRKPGFATLEALILGYEWATIDRHPVESETPPFIEFSAFVCRELGRQGELSAVTGMGIEWQTAIVDAQSDDQSAFDLFFDLLTRYRAQ